MLSVAVGLFSPWEMEGGCVCIRKPWILVNPLLFEKLGRPDKNCFPDCCAGSSSALMILPMILGRHIGQRSIGTILPSRAVEVESSQWVNKNQVVDARSVGF